MTASKTVDDVLEINRKLLKVLGNRLDMDDPAEEFAANEYFYISTFVSPDEIIRTDTDSVFVACGIMFPNLPWNMNDLAIGDNLIGELFVIEQMSAGRVLMQGSTSDGTLQFGLQSIYVDAILMGPNVVGTSVETNNFGDFDNKRFDCNAQFFLKEPFLVPPGSALRNTFIDIKNITNSSANLKQVGQELYNKWILTGYKVKLV